MGEWQDRNGVETGAGLVVAGDSGHRGKLVRSVFAFDGLGGT